jgi:hypothetical protein
MEAAAVVAVATRRRCAVGHYGVRGPRSMNPSTSNRHRSGWAVRGAGRNAAETKVEQQARRYGSKDKSSVQYSQPPIPVSSSVIPLNRVCCSALPEAGGLGPQTDDAKHRPGQRRGSDSPAPRCPCLPIPCPLVLLCFPLVCVSSAAACVCVPVCWRAETGGKTNPPLLLLLLPLWRHSHDTQERSTGKGVCLHSTVVHTRCMLLRLLHGCCRLCWPAEAGPVPLTRLPSLRPLRLPATHDSSLNGRSEQLHSLTDTPQHTPSWPTDIHSSPMQARRLRDLTARLSNNNSINTDRRANRAMALPHRRAMARLLRRPTTGSNPHLCPRTVCPVADLPLVPTAIRQLLPTEARLHPSQALHHMAAALDMVHRLRSLADSVRHRRSRPTAPRLPASLRPQFKTTAMPRRRCPQLDLIRLALLPRPRRATVLCRLSHRLAHQCRNPMAERRHNSMACPRRPIRQLDTARPCRRRNRAVMVCLSRPCRRKWSLTTRPRWARMDPLHMVAVATDNSNTARTNRVAMRRLRRLR